MGKKRPPPPVPVDPDAHAKLLAKAHKFMFGGKDKRSTAEIQIPWQIVDEFLAAGASGFMIAGMLGIHEDTLYNACKRDHDQEFRQYKAQKKAGGDAMLLMAQFRNALGGDFMLQIWLGKNRLNQRDKPPEDSGNGKGGGFVILEIGDNQRSVKNQNPANKPPDEKEDPEAEVDTSGLE